MASLQFFHIILPWLNTLSMTMDYFRFNSGIPNSTGTQFNCDFKKVLNPLWFSPPLWHVIPVQCLWIMLGLMAVMRMVHLSRDLNLHWAKPEVLQVRVCQQYNTRAQLFPKRPNLLSICTWFLKCLVWNMEFDKLDFFSLFELNFWRLHRQ